MSHLSHIITIFLCLSPTRGLRTIPEYARDFSEHCKRRDALPSVFLSRRVMEADAQVLHFSRLDMPYSCISTVRTEAGHSIIMVVEISPVEVQPEFCNDGYQLRVFEYAETFGGYWGPIPDAVLKQDPRDSVYTKQYTLATKPPPITTTTAKRELKISPTTTSTTSRSTPVTQDYITVDVPLVNLSVILEEVPITEYQRPFDPDEFFDQFYDVVPRPGQAYKTSILPLVQVAVKQQPGVQEGDGEPRYELDYVLGPFTQDHRLTTPAWSTHINTNRNSNRWKKKKLEPKTKNSQHMREPVKSRKLFRKQYSLQTTNHKPSYDHVPPKVITENKLVDTTETEPFNLIDNIMKSLNESGDLKEESTTSDVLATFNPSENSYHNLSVYLKPYQTLEFLPVSYFPVNFTSNLSEIPVRARTESILRTTKKPQDVLENTRNTSVSEYNTYSFRRKQSLENSYTTSEKATVTNEEITMPTDEIGTVKHVSYRTGTETTSGLIIGTSGNPTVETSVPGNQEQVSNITATQPFVVQHSNFEPTQPFDEQHSNFEARQPFEDQHSNFEARQPFEEQHSNFEARQPFEEQHSNFEARQPFEEQHSNFEATQPLADDGLIPVIPTERSLSGTLVDHESWENVVQSAPVMAGLLNLYGSELNNSSRVQPSDEVAAQYKRRVRRRRHISAIEVEDARPHRRATTTPPSVRPSVFNAIDVHDFARLMELPDDQMNNHVTVKLDSNSSEPLFDVCNMSNGSKSRFLVVFNSSRILLSISNFTLPHVMITLTTARPMALLEQQCPETMVECQVEGIRLCIENTNACNGIPNCGSAYAYDEDRVLCGVIDRQRSVYLAAATCLAVLVTMLYIIHYWLRRCVPNVALAFFVYYESADNELYLDSIMRSPMDPGDQYMYNSALFDEENLLYSQDTRKSTNFFKRVFSIFAIIKLFKRQRSSKQTEEMQGAGRSLSTEVYNNNSFTSSELRSMMSDGRDQEVQTGESLEMAYLKLINSSKEESGKIPSKQRKPSVSHVVLRDFLKSQISSTLESSSDSPGPSARSASIMRHPGLEEKEIQSTLYDPGTSNITQRDKIIPPGAGAGRGRKRLRFNEHTTYIPRDDEEDEKPVEVKESLTKKRANKKDDDSGSQYGGSDFRNFFRKKKDHK